MTDRETAQINEAYDVIVVGGGSAGMCATVQSARAGASTLLIEKTGCLGGTTTNGGVNFPGLFHAWGKQVIKGIGWELIERCFKESGDTFPDFSVIPERHWHHQVLVDRAVYTALCDEIVVESGAQILFHSMPAALREVSDTEKVLTLCSKTGLRDIRAQVVIDCSADANLAGLAGYALSEAEHKQPATLSCAASGYDYNALDIPAINQAFDKWVAEGRGKYTDASWNAQGAAVGMWLSKHGSNANHIGGFDAFSSEGKTALELESRRVILRMYRFLKQQPGLEQLRIDFMSPECGVRDTRRIIGENTVSAEDYLSGRAWPDGVCYSYYPIDLHSDQDGGLDCRQLEQGVVPSIPRSAMIPKGSQNFLVAGRCISADDVANSALRVQGSCMAMGQAAGAMAALAAKDGLLVAELPMRAIHELLEAHGAIVPALAE